MGSLLGFREDADQVFLESYRSSPRKATTAAGGLWNRREADLVPSWSDTRRPGRYPGKVSDTIPWLHEHSNDLNQSYSVLSFFFGSLCWVTLFLWLFHSFRYCGNEDPNAQQHLEHGKLIFNNSVQIQARVSTGRGQDVNI